MPMTVLLVEDEANIINLVKAIFKSVDYHLVVAGSGREAVSLVASHPPDIVLLDLGLPDQDGLDVLGRIREFSSVPVIVVSAREQEREKVRAFDLGADDYITKPFGSSEFLARIRTALRHANFRHNVDVLMTQAVNIGNLLIDFEKRVVSLNGEPVHLTPIEYKIVSLMSKNIGKTLTHDYILREIWGPYENDNQALRVNMANIRRKIEKNPAQPEYIVTEVGVGYRMADF